MSVQAEILIDGSLSLVEGDRDFRSLTEQVCGLVLRPARPWWWLAFAISGPLGVLGAVMTVYVVQTGVGVWGLNQTVGWGFDIANFMFWIGIGHAGTLISAGLFLLRQKWRSSLNRAAEAMTLCAVACAGWFVLIHLGRAWTAWFMLPAPSATAIYPNFRSALSWDCAAIAIDGTVSLMFCYVGLIPDLATLRDRAPNVLAQRIFGLLALGWRGSARHWHNFEMAYLMLAGVATPMVVVGQTIVSFDIATSIVPGWHSTLFPFYFVTGAIFSGLAMVLALMILFRAACRLSDLITLNTLENICKLLLATSLLIGYAYIVELFSAFSGGNSAAGLTFRDAIWGPYRWCYATVVVCNVLLPQLFWLRPFRTTPWVMFLIALFVNIGMWLERFVVVAVSLTHDYLPSSWKMFYPTGADFLHLLGGFGLFSTLFLLFVRFLPMVALSEVKACLPAAAANSGSRLEHDPHETTMTGFAAIGPGRRVPLYGALARFDGPSEVLAAIRRLHDHGYRRLDAYSPFPIPGTGPALKLGRSRLPVVVLAGGAFGGVFAYTLQWYESTIAYPLNTGGKPLNSALAFVPIMFETAMLIAAFAALFGMLAANGLPRLYHPVFRGKSFARASDDGFFLSVEARDPLFDAHQTAVILESLGATEIELIES